MTPDELRATVTGDAPPAGVAGPLAALWWAAKGDWHKAHEMAQADEGATCAWVHAHLHRIEGDLDNAGYWYRRAGRPRSVAALPEEWDEIAAALLAP